jgi:hypothetical protein
MANEEKLEITNTMAENNVYDAKIIMKSFGKQKRRNYVNTCTLSRVVDIQAGEGNKWGKFTYFR